MFRTIDSTRILRFMYSPGACAPLAMQGCADGLLVAYIPSEAFPNS